MATQRNRIQTSFVDNGRVNIELNCLVVWKTLALAGQWRAKMVEEAALGGLVISLRNWSLNEGNDENQLKGTCRK